MANLSRRQFAQNASLFAGAVGISQFVNAQQQEDVEQEKPSETETNTLPAPDLAVHILKRISFGISNADLTRLEQVGMERYLQEQLKPELLDDSQVTNLVAQFFPTVSLTTAEILQLPREEQNRVPGQLRFATLFRRWLSRRQLNEVMVEFWSDHFSVDQNDNFVRFLKTTDDRDVIRPHALGKFRDLLQANAKSPAMLFYLDNYTNTQDGPNENYARELQELHTLGVDGGFTEQDVLEVARCFTGWTIYPLRAKGRAGTFRFNARAHDQGEKVVLGERIPAGQGIADGEQVLDILASHPSTAGFIASKLCRRFVADNPSDTLVELVSATYIATDGDIRAMLISLFSSEEFLTSADAKYTRPVEFLGALFRTLDVEYQDGAVRQIQDIVSQLGHMPFNWPAPNGYPDVTTYWASTNGLLARWDFALELSQGNLRGLSLDLPSLVGEANTPEQLVDTLTQRVLRRSLREEDRTQLIQYASGGELQTQASGVLALMLCSQYFQLR